MNRKNLCFLLCFCLVLSLMLPVTASAAGGEGSEPERAPACRIGALTVLDGEGEPGDAIPAGPFRVMVPVTLRENGDALVFLAAYAEDGLYRGFLCESLQNAAGGKETALTFTVENPTGDIVSLKAFAVPSFEDLTPLGPAGEFSTAAEESSFPADLFAAVQSDSPNKSLSPVSVEYALGLLRAGADGTNRDQLDKLLEGVDFGQWNETLTTVGNGPVIEVANSIWFDTSVTPSKTYLDTVKKDLNAESRTLDLPTTEAMDTINSWVCEKTHELIRSILDEPLDDDAAAVLINALYFKGDWRVPFEQAGTHDQAFLSRDGKEAQVPFMHDTRDGMLYIDAETCRGVALPYKGDQGWYMLALLPKDGRTADSLAGEDFGALLAGAQGSYVRLALPKFTIEGSYDLTTPLRELGLTAAFEGGFSPMGFCSKGPIVLSRVLQKTYLRVDEEGTEAAAVTAAVGKANAFPGPQPVEVTFDRPFLCCLWNDQLGQPLFLTAVNELK